ncbi:hypothetical protein FDB42_02015 [Clostridium botulinum]|nr:hypothetical protein [Clostridium botulinum]NFO46544.1 hypothetical protein [Clostridium botulinum]
MSKFSISLSYKDCCILKHALRDKINFKEEIKDDVLSIALNVSQEPMKFNKELLEEKRTLERFTEEIETIKENHHMKVR